MITMASTLTLVAACTFGRVMPAASGMRVEARAPAGVARSGELLATPGSGIVFLDDLGQVVFTRFSVGISLRNAPARTRWPRVRIRGMPDAGDLEKLRFHSRYPLGLSGETLNGLLVTLDQGQTEVWP